jgi:hypothetical protein
MTEYRAHASCLMDAGSRALISEHDDGDSLGFAHDLRKRICFMRVPTMKRALAQHFPGKVPAPVGGYGAGTCCACRRCTHPLAGALSSGLFGKKLSCVGQAAASAATFCFIPCMT